MESYPIAVLRSPVVKLLRTFLPSPRFLFPVVSYKSTIPPELEIETTPETVKASDKVVAPATASVLLAVTAPVRVEAPETVKASDKVVAPATASVLLAVTAPVRVEAPVTVAVPSKVALPSTLKSLSVVTVPEV
jgi:hypothetical protein